MRRRPLSIAAVALAVALCVTLLALIFLANRIIAVALGAAAFAIVALWLRDRRRGHGLRRGREQR